MTGHSAHSALAWLRSCLPAALIYTRIVALCAGSAFILALLWTFARDPYQFASHVSLFGFSLSVIIGIFANAAIGAVFVQVVGKTAPMTTKSSRLKAYYYTQIAKYVPGRVVALLMQRAILSGPNTLTATIVSNIELTGISVCLCSGAALSLLLCIRSLFSGLLTASLFICLGAILLKADWVAMVGRLYAFLCRRRVPKKDKNSKAEQSVTEALLLSFLLFVFPAASIYVLLNIGIRLNWSDAATFSALLLLSWVGGMIAFVFPAGIGVRELVFFSLGSALAQFTSSETLAGIALLSRAVQVTVDVLGSLLFVALYRFIGTKEAHARL